MAWPSNILSNVCFLNGLWFFVNPVGIYMFKVNNRNTRMIIHLFPNYHDIIVKNVISSKHKNFGVIGKIIWFWSIVNKEPRLIDITWHGRVLKFVKLVGKNGKIKVIGHYSANFTAFPEFFLSNMFFS